MSPNDGERIERLQASYTHWLKHRSILERYRVKPGDRRTTPPAAYVVSELFPELTGQAKVSVRLHPRYGDEAPADASKLGGMFLWPENEPWPVCSAHQIPLVSLLQLCARDFPEMSFPPGTDLFQMLWCPRDHADVPECRDMPCPMYWADPRFYWRDREHVTRPRKDNPPPQEADYAYVPLPCRLLPERVIEYPSVHDMPEDLVNRIYEWQDKNLGSDGMHACTYEWELSAAEGTKIGGYVSWFQFPWIPACRCGQIMEHLLTIASHEWQGIIGRWTPTEDRAILATFSEKWEECDEDRKAMQLALWNPTGLSFPDVGHMQLFVCRHCGEWPIVPHIECC